MKRLINEPDECVGRVVMATSDEPGFLAIHFDDCALVIRVSDVMGSLVSVETDLDSDQALALGLIDADERAAHYERVFEKKRADLQASMRGIFGDMLVDLIRNDPNARRRLEAVLKEVFPS